MLAIITYNTFTYIALSKKIWKLYPGLAEYVLICKSYVRFTLQLAAFWFTSEVYIRINQLID